MKRWLLVGLILFLPSLARGQNPTIQGWCETGAQPVVTSGLTSSTQVQQSFPACTVTVFIHGGGLATIFSDSSGTPLSNPFTAQSNGRWLFYAVAGRYDVQMSGAGFPSSVTYPDINTSGAGGGGSISGLTAGQVAIAGSATTITSSKPLVGTDANVLSAGTVTGLGQSLCVDSNGGATTTGCAGAFGTFTVLATQLATAGGQILFCDTQSTGAGGFTCSVTGTDVTCSLGVFASGDVGKTIWGGSNFTVTIADQLIASFVSSTHITLTSAALSNGALTVLRWGHDDTPAWDVVNTSFNNLLVSGSGGAGGPYCLIVPSGMSTFKHATLVVNPTIGYNLANYPACYRSFGLLTFSPVPDFNYTFFNPGTTNIQLISTAQGTSFGPSATPSYVENILADGGSVNTGGGACNMAGHIQEGMFLGQTEARNVGIENWCPLTANWSPITVNNTAMLYNLSCQTSGINCITATGSSDFAPIEIIGGSIGGNQGASGGCGLQWNTSINTSHVTFYPPGIMTCPQGGTWHSKSDVFPEVGGGGPQIAISPTGTNNIFIDDAFGQSPAGKDWLVSGGANNTITISRSKLNAGTGQKICNTATNGGTCYDGGGNTITGSFASDWIPTTNNGIFGVGTGVATFNTTLFLVAPQATNTAFTNTTTTTSSGVAPFTGTISNLVCTATTGASVGGDGVVTVRTAPLSTGTFAATTMTATFGTTTSAKDQTHTASVTQGQPIQFQVVTNNAGSETLAGVQCRVSEY